MAPPIDTAYVKEMVVSFREHRTRFEELNEKVIKLETLHEIEKQRTVTMISVASVIVASVAVLVSFFL